MSRRLVSWLLPLASVAASVFAALPARAADEAPLERLAACTDAWLDWERDPVAAVRFRDYFLPRFTEEPRSPAWHPKRPMTVFGLLVTKVYPQSVGMGLGFSIEVRGEPDAVRRVMETAIGRPLKCEATEGVVSCEVKLAHRRTALLVTNDAGRGQESLLGCFYYYQQ